MKIYNIFVKKNFEMIVDLLLFVFIVSGFYLGFTKGFMKVIGFVLTIICCLVLTIKVSPVIHQWLSEHVVGLENGVHMVSIGLGLACTLACLGLILYFIQSKVNLANLGPVNKITGGLALMGIFLLAYSSLVWFCDQSSIFSKSTKQNSVSYEYLIKINDKSSKSTKYLRPVLNSLRGMSEASMQIKKTKNT